MNVEISDVMEALSAVEEILHYRFKNQQLLRAALTHPSCNDYTSYNRLEFLGDAHLTSAISDYIYSLYPEVDRGKLTLLRSVNISNEKFARVAVRHGLYKHILSVNTSDLGKKIEEFVIKVQQENEPVIHGGLVKAPKVLANIVESVAAAIHADCNNSHLMWNVMKHLMEPIITLEMLKEEPQPVSLLFERCSREGKQVEIKHCTNGEIMTASVYIDGNHVTSFSAEQIKSARLHAAKAALELLPAMECDLSSAEFAGAYKQKLHEACVKKKWPKPIYTNESSGSDHMKTFICSVEIKVKDDVLRLVGEGKGKRKEAENSAACAMLYGLKDAGYI